MSSSDSDGPSLGLDGLYDFGYCDAFVAATSVVCQTGTREKWTPGETPQRAVIYMCNRLQYATLERLETGMRAVLIFTGLVSIVTLGLEVSIVIDIYKKRKFLEQRIGHWYTSLLRVILFSMYRIVSLSLNLQMINHTDEKLLIGISRNNVFDGVIDFVQAAIFLTQVLL
ncbi:uncharacterized protein FOMMEDRAFT_29262 [Fomitiporia mediterranea MF3/22]|uniref:uncharacterized protein n=1 Tax=Fomitiporia mediterranea (strain MF3/22) TaxID=694068 RepID=UPI00044092CE|nr:uncharacterized protein FOMMEDRAFT_29262 [Fomitiporia mediterranea MF3/22]EJD02188.1 hypothetical protein FOMMEDRAFT_29262 [Fomitiporia mediterranea MF3/22]